MWGWGVGGGGQLRAQLMECTVQPLLRLFLAELSLCKPPENCTPAAVKGLINFAKFCHGGLMIGDECLSSLQPREDGSVERRTGTGYIVGLIGGGPQGSRAAAEQVFAHTRSFEHLVVVIIIIIIIIIISGSSSMQQLFLLTQM
ncbi:hypothetical protein EYF80_015078 [Liparis tanakae]|uniref:Uncharacterized protein n=1 Tax=Liparis tanakae TaxID=230148 RepID=A0A4Z2IA55_9TELE|nr:hypothetical protein EYF80_015078 [Liparis tanakae]